MDALARTCIPFWLKILSVSYLRLYERIKIDLWTTTATLRKNNTAFVIYKYVETCGIIACKVDIGSTNLDSD